MCYRKNSDMSPGGKNYRPTPDTMNGSELSDGSSRNCFNAATQHKAKLNSNRGVDETLVIDTEFLN